MRIIKTNVKHDGRDFAKGDECPKELEKEFILQGLLEPEAKPQAKPAAQAQSKPAANSEPKQPESK